MRMYIVGSVASGKSTLARQLSARTGVPCVHLDDVVYEPDSTDPAGNRKRPEAERERLFQEILAGDFLIEDTGRAMFEEGLRRAEQIVVLELPFRTRCRRIFTRHIRQTLGLEACGYRPSLRMVRDMFRWTRNFDTGADGVKARIAPYREKTVALRSVGAVREFVESMGRAQAAARAGKDGSERD